MKTSQIFLLVALSLLCFLSCNSISDVEGVETHRYLYKGAILYKYISDTERGDSIGIIDKNRIGSFRQYLHEFWSCDDYWKYEYKDKLFYLNTENTGWLNYGLEDSTSKFGKMIVRTILLESDKEVEKEIMRILILDTNINMPDVDYAPTIAPDGKTLVFVSQRNGSKTNREGEPTHDFWAVRKVNRYDSSFAKPYNIDTAGYIQDWRGINTSTNEGVATIAADGRTLYFTACNRPDGLGDCDIYSARIFEGKWSKPLNLDREVNSAFWDSQPSISPDMKVLYFASNRPGPNGNDNFDIWYSIWDDNIGEWQPAMNLSGINTEGKDLAPFIASDGATLFFSSDGYDSTCGGLDFYVSKYDVENRCWSKPAHLTEPLNSPEDEEFITLPASGDIAYFSSRRKDIPGYQGDLDLYMAYMETVFKAIVLKIYVADDSETNTVTTVTVDNPISKRRVRDVGTSKDNTISMVLTNTDYGVISDSLPFIDLKIRAENPIYGNKQKILRVKNPLIDKESKGWLFDNELDETFEISVSPEFEEYLISLKRTILDAAVKAYNIEGGEVLDTAYIQIEEFHSSTTKPLLPYIFFENNSASIPSRYRLLDRNEALSFKMDSLFSLGTLDTYYHLLNITGWRMTQYPEAKLVITGCNSAKDEEEDNLNLSKVRAAQVMGYLTGTWGIDSSRISIEARNLPESPSRGMSEQGIEENRRVELSSTDKRILAPVTTSQIIKITTPEQIDFKSFVSVKGGEATWELNLMQDSRILKSFSGEGSLNEDLIWELSEEQNTLPTNENPVKIELLVKDKSRDKIIVAKGELPVRLITSQQKSSIFTEDKRIDKYSLILFDFAKSRLNDGNLDIIKMIKDSINQEANVIITGYTDIIGNENFNMKLSGKRAEETGQALAIKNVEIKAMGNTKLLYDNILPEGRFYCRTVEIVIETPITGKAE